MRKYYLKYKLNKSMGSTRSVLAIVIIVHKVGFTLPVSILAI